MGRHLRRRNTPPPPAPTAAPPRRQGASCSRASPWCAQCRPGWRQTYGPSPPALVSAPNIPVPYQVDVRRCLPGGATLASLPLGGIEGGPGRGAEAPLFSPREKIEMRGPAPTARGPRRLPSPRPRRLPCRGDSRIARPLRLWRPSHNSRRWLTSGRSGAERFFPLPLWGRFERGRAPSGARAPARRCSVLGPQLRKVSSGRV